MSDQNCMSCVHWDTKRVGLGGDWGDCTRPYANPPYPGGRDDTSPIQTVQPADAGIETLATFSCNEWNPGFDEEQTND